MLLLMISIFVLFCAVSYLMICVFFIRGWYKMPVFKNSEGTTGYPYISVIVAARNEEKHIDECLQSLIMQDYSKDLMEIIIVDDHSTDATVKRCRILKNLYKDINIRLLFNKDINREGKKEAIRYGVEQASGNIILTTDADCKMLPLWAVSMTSCMQKNNYKLVCGPVTYYKEKGLFSKFESLDFLSMIVSGAGAISLHAPFMANAANMAFEKETYLNLYKAHDNSRRASGDDVFLLHKIKQADSRSVGFIKSKDALIYTYGTNKIGKFFSQRLRWAAKSKSYKDFHAQAFTLIVFLFNFSIVLSACYLFFNPGFVYFFTALYITKMGIDFPLLYGITRFTGQTHLLKHYVWVQLLYPFYITTAGIWALFIRKINWKGRRVR